MMEWVTVETADPKTLFLHYVVCKQLKTSHSAPARFPLLLKHATEQLDMKALSTHNIWAHICQERDRLCFVFFPVFTVCEQKGKTVTS